MVTRRDVAAQIREMKRERDQKLADVERLPYSESVKSLAKNEISEKFQKSISGLLTIHEKELQNQKEKLSVMGKVNKFLKEGISPGYIDYGLFFDCINEFKNDYKNSKSREYFSFLSGFLSDKEARLNVIICKELLDIHRKYTIEYDAEASLKRLFKKDILKNKDLIKYMSYKDIVIVFGFDRELLDLKGFEYDDIGYRIVRDYDPQHVVHTKDFHNLSRDILEDYHLNDFPLSSLRPEEIDVGVLSCYLKNDIMDFIHCIYEQDFTNAIKYNGKIMKVLDGYKSRISIKEFCKSFFTPFVCMEKIFYHGKCYEKGELISSIKNFIDKFNGTCFIPKNFEELRDEHDMNLLVGKNPRDILPYCYNMKACCEKYFEEPQKFVIGFNPDFNIRTIKLMNYNYCNHRDFINTIGFEGYEILGGGRIDRIGNDFYIYGSSEEFGGFENYHGVIYDILTNRYPGCRIYFKESVRPKSNNFHH